MDEFERIAQIRSRFEVLRPDIQVGIGDDAAVLAPSDASQVLSVDVAIEDVHFRRGWATMTQIGRRAFVAAASDLAAMAARPRAALLSLVLPEALDDASLLALVDGVARGASECGCAVVGGNLAAGSELSITTTVVGEVGQRWLTRSGARPGDQIYVTGVVGASALGLAFLQAGRGDDERARVVVERWRHPTARLQTSQRLLDVATAAIDISDGLVADLGHLCAASGVDARIDAEELPVPEAFAELAGSLGRDPMSLSLAGGEDYELLFTAPACTLAKQLATRIGRVEPGAGSVVVIGADGAPMAPPSAGYRHF